MKNANHITREEKHKVSFTGFNARQSSSHLNVLSTEVLFLLSVTQAGTSSAKVAHIFGLMQEIIST